MVGLIQRGCLLLAVLLIMGKAVSAQQLRAGAAVRVITPNPLLPVSGGVGTPQPTTEKWGDLYIRVLVLEKGDVRLALVGIDNLGWPSVLGDKARALIDDIPPENVLIGATHTHSAPDAYGFPDENGQHHADLQYLGHCVGLMADAVNEAVSKLEPAMLKIGMGEAQGKIAFNYYAESLYDPRCGVMQAISLDGQTIATLVNYAVHPEVIGSKRGILSPDLCGPLYERIEQRAGGIALFMNGALGGMVTADNRPDELGSQPDPWHESIRIGELLADEALRILDKAEILVDPQIRCLAKEISFPVASRIMQHILAYSPLAYLSDSPNQVTTRINAMQIGPATFLTIPGEALPNIGYYLKRNMQTEYPFLLGLTNDAFGYILTKVDYDSFRRYDYITRTSLGEMTGELYIEAALDLVSKLYP